MVQAVLESSSPESGGAGGEPRPAGPQSAVPTVVVKESMVNIANVVVVVEVVTVTVVVVAGAPVAVVVVVVTTVPVVVVVGAPVPVVVVVGPPGHEQSA